MRDLAVTLSTLLGCALLGVAAQSARAQQPVAPSPDRATAARPAAHAGMHAAAGVWEHAGALLGAARSYRAEFGPADVEFLPVLGKSAPAPRPVRIALRDITRGDLTLLDAAGSQVERSHDRTSVTFRRGAIAERYETRPEGIEQSFAFATPLAGTGDLVVRLDLQTTLRPDLREPALFTDGRGGVRFGKVLGIDANGARCDGSIRHQDGGLELRLPGWFVDRAAYPLLLDPLIGTVTEGYPGADTDYPDVAYDAYTDAYCVVWTQFFGGSTTGVVGSVWQRQGLTRAYAFAINQPGNEDSIRTCLIGGAGVFVLAWINRTSVGDTLCGIALEPVQAQGTNIWQLWGPGTLGGPILSGEATAYDDDCLIAWTDDQYGLLGCSLSVDPQLQVGASQVIQIAGGSVAEPAISKQGGDIGMHLVTWIDRPLGSSGWLRAQVVDHDMNLVGPGVWVQNLPQDCGYPAVDGDGFRFLVAWEQQEIANPSGYDLKGRILTVGANGFTSMGAVLDLVTWPGDLDIAVDVALLGDKFGIVYEGRPAANPSTADAYFLAIARNGTPIGAEQRLDLTLGNQYLNEYAPRLIGRCAGDANLLTDDGLVVFADQSIATADANVGLQEIAAMGPGGPVLDLGGGCGPGGLAVQDGPFALGNGNFAVELYGAMPLAVPFLLIGWPTPPQTCGVCTAVNAWSCSFVPNSAGYGTATVPLPADAAFVGLTLDFQFASFLVPYVGCPYAAGLALSNIVRATLDY
ncbi:MAG: hypothetical protein RL398_561 [Planctomycetota bacterium]|jgi:hypothetical protein